jgi:predicted deacylase
MRDPITIGDVTVQAGSRSSVELPVGELYTQTTLTLPVHVIHGKQHGPVLFLFAALHGDEINGVEIIRRVLASDLLERLRGSLIAVPVVNIYGFINRTRHLPDRRDLNRSFPGTAKGSTAARFARLLLTQVVSKCTHGIDLHTAIAHREYMPHARARMGHTQTRNMACAFGMPVVMDTELRGGSLRQAALNLDIPVIVYEAGEALRFDEISIRTGVRGVMAVMQDLGMLPKMEPNDVVAAPMVATSGSRVRAGVGGILRSLTPLGAPVRKGARLGVISDPCGEKETSVEATTDGIVIGRATLPLVNEGEVLFHIARFEDPDSVVEQLEEFRRRLDPATGESTPPAPPIV